MRQEPAVTAGAVVGVGFGSVDAGPRFGLQPSPCTARTLYIALVRGQTPTTRTFGRRSRACPAAHSFTAQLALAG
jgi:hypothetical protein